MKKRVFAWMLTLAMVLSCVNLPSLTAAALNSNSIEAEDAVGFGGANITSDHGGYTGTGFMSGFSDIGRGVTFENINATESGYYSLRIRYANGGDTKTLSVYTNENTAESKRVDFPRTWGWDYYKFGVWGNVYTNVYLEQGSNTISLAFLEGDSGNINVDNIALSSSLITVNKASGLVNGGFDAGNTDGWALWDDGNSGYGVDSGDTAVGSHKFYFHSGDPYKQRISQTVTGLENGTYLVSLFIKISGSDPNVCRLELSDYDGENKTLLDFIKRPNEQNPYEWYEQEVVVKDGQLDIGIYCDTPGGLSIQLDEFQLFQVVDKNSLNDAVKNASVLNESDYTSDSWSAFSAALTGAGDILNKSNATHKETDDALSDLSTALSNLEEAAAEFTVSATAGENGSISPAEQTVVDGDTATFTITPADGYETDTITVTPEMEYALAESEMTIANVPSDLQVNVTFKQTQKSTDKSAADHVIGLISAIGTVTAGSEDAIVAAETAYANLTETQQALVTNYSVLTDARAAYDLLIENPVEAEVLLDLDFSKYTGDGTSSAAITDNAGNLTSLSSSTLKAETVRGKTGIRFTGSNQDTDLVHWSAATYDPFSQIDEGVTISIWMNTQSRTNWAHVFNYATGKNYVDDSGDTEYTGNYLIMQHTDSDTFLRTALAIEEDISENRSGSWGDNMNKWALLTFTQDTTTKEVNLYLNGEKFQTYVANHSLYEISNKANAASKGPKSVNYFIGGPQPHAWDTDFGIDAVVSGFTIYDNALTADQVADLYNSDQQYADYTAVYDAIEAAEAALESGNYTADSVNDLRLAIQVVVWEKAASEQAEVDAMATAIVNATNALVEKVVTPDEVMQKKTYTAEDGTVLPYRLYLPENYDSSKDYPVLLFLHGAGERGTDNQNHIKNNVGIINRIINSNDSDYDCIIVAPQCANDNQWVDTDWSKGSYDQSKVGISKYLKATNSLLDELKSTYSVDDARLYITGLSMGGYGTWDYITRYPDMFAAAIPLCGAGDPSKSDLIKDMPIWAFHGDADGTVPVKGSRDMVEALEEFDGQVKYTEYAGVGHDCWNKAYAETNLLIWMFAQVKPSLASIEVTTMPTKTVYTEGEDFDPAGMVVTANYDDGSTEDVTDYTISGYESTLGTKTITVTYKDKTVTFEVTVESDVIPGDVNNDNDVTVTDIVSLRSIIMSGVSPTAAQLAVADLNDDGKLTVTDIVALRSIIMN